MFLKASLDEDGAPASRIRTRWCSPVSTTAPSSASSPRPRLVEVCGLTPTGAVEPDVASAGGPCCDGRGCGYLYSRWRIVGADKTPGCGAAAGSPCARPSSSFLLPLPTLLRARYTTLRGLSLLLLLLFGCALPLDTAFRDPSTTQSRLELPRHEPKD